MSKIIAIAAALTVTAWGAPALAHVGFLSPESGMELSPAELVEVSWEDTIPHDTVGYDLDFRASPEAEWEEIEHGIGAHSLTWTVPDLECDQCVLRVIQINNGMNYESAVVVSIHGDTSAAPAEPTDAGSAEPAEEADAEPVEEMPDPAAPPEEGVDVSPATTPTAPEVAPPEPEPVPSSPQAPTAPAPGPVEAEGQTTPTMLPGAMTAPSVAQEPPVDTMDTGAPNQTARMDTMNADGSSAGDGGCGIARDVGSPFGTLVVLGLTALGAGLRKRRADR